MIKESANEFAMQVFRPAAVHSRSNRRISLGSSTAAWENGLMNTHIQEERWEQYVLYGWNDCC